MPGRPHGNSPKMHECVAAAKRSGATNPWAACKATVKGDQTRPTKGVKKLHRWTKGQR